MDPIRRQNFTMLVKDHPFYTESDNNKHNRKMHTEKDRESGKREGKREGERKNATTKGKRGMKMYKKLKVSIIVMESETYSFISCISEGQRDRDSSGAPYRQVIHPVHTLQIYPEHSRTDKTMYM